MSLDLGMVELLGAESIGQPGQRRFRLFVRSLRGSAILWLEKEQLNNLSLALDRFLAQITQGEVLRTEAQVGGLPPPPTLPVNFPKHPDQDFQVGQLRINYDESRQNFSLSAAPLEIIAEPGKEPRAEIQEEESLTFFFTQKQAQNLTRAITSVVSSGRPVCPLCNTPLDGSPHACVKQNGHYQVVQAIEEDTDEEEEDE